MEWVGWFCLVIILCYSSYPGKVKKLENEMKEIKKLNKRQGGTMEMPRILSELIGKDCIIKTDEAIFFAGNREIKCTIQDTDDEWIKFTYTDKNKVLKTQILRIESIESVGLVSE